jgi:hypothetical protein
MTAKPKQVKYIADVIDSFLKSIGVDVPSDDAEKKATFINVLKKAIRNHETAKMIKGAVEAAGGSINKERNLYDDIKL